MRPLAPRPSEMSRGDFVARFGALYEHSPWIAERAWQTGLGRSADTVDGLADHLAQTVLSAPKDRQLALIRAHPDLAGRLGTESLSAASRAEQSSAALDCCTPQELERFQALNTAYRARFGFPFVIAVRGLDRSAILEAFEQRLENEREVEFHTALNEINKIARLRLESHV